jgi:outer membrane receptor protein involved in Fe transport
VELDNIENTHWKFGVFVKNIADRAYLLAPVVLLNSFPDSVGIYAPPRQYGAEARYTF